MGNRRYKGRKHQNSGGGGLYVAALVFFLLCISAALWVYTRLVG